MLVRSAGFQATSGRPPRWCQLHCLPASQLGMSWSGSPMPASMRQMSISRQADIRLALLKHRPAFPLMPVLRLLGLLLLLVLRLQVGLTLLPAFFCFAASSVSVLPSNLGPHFPAIYSADTVSARSMHSTAISHSVQSMENLTAQVVRTDCKHLGQGLSYAGGHCPCCRGLCALVSPYGGTVVWVQGWRWGSQ